MSLHRWLAMAGVTLAAAAGMPGGALIEPPPTVVTGGPVVARPAAFVGTFASVILPVRLDADDHLDLVVVNRGLTSSGSGAGSLSIVYGRGDGTLDEAVDLAPGSKPHAAAVADVNGDGANDIVVAAFQPAPALRVYLSNGQRVFVVPPIVNTAAGPIYGLATGDFNGDGDVDVAVSLRDSDQVQIMLGGGDGTFTEGALLGGAHRPEELATGDLDEDEIADLVVAGRGAPCSAPECVPEPGDLAWLRGRGDGTFDDAVSLVHGPGFISVVLGDFTGDGHVDVAATGGGDDFDGGVLIVPVAGAAGPGEPFTLIGDGWTGSIGLAVVDGNGDHIDDLVVGLARLGDFGPIFRLSTLLMHGDMTFEEVPFPELSYFAVGAVSAADLTADGRPEALIAYFRPYLDAVEVLVGAGEGRYAVETCLATGMHFADVVTADLDLDGFADVVALDSGGEPTGRTGPPVVLVFLATSAGEFSLMPGIELPGQGFAGAGFESYLRVADFNVDGIPDLAVLNVLASEVAILLGRGDGTFNLAAPVPTGQLPLDSVVGNFDGDGIADLAVLLPCNDAYCQRGRVAVHRGIGDGGFYAPVNSEVEQVFGPTTLVAGDFDEDGRSEIAVTSFPGGVDLYPVGIDLHLGLPTKLGPGVGGTTVDFDRDGHLDLLAGSLYRGNGDGTFGPGPALSGLVGVHPTTPDLNGDGWPDLVSTYGSSHGIVVNASDGQGGFLPQSTFYWLVRGTGVAPIDFDRDERTDIVFADVFHVPSRICVAPNLSGSPDADADGVPDAADTCIDSDGDGLADRLTSASACALDNCPAAPNAAQTDSDEDGRGDACDVCPFDAQNDTDHDGACGSADVCPGVYDPVQDDQDHDGFGDACDNCPLVVSADQADRDGDGAGDACQPHLEILGIQEDGGDDLEVRVALSDPQGDPIETSVEVFGPPTTGFPLDNLALHFDDPCNTAYWLPSGGPVYEGGMVYYSDGGSRALADVDSELGCHDFRQDYAILRGRCADVAGRFYGSPNGSLDLGGIGLPVDICIARFPALDVLRDLTIVSLDDREIRFATEPEQLLVSGGAEDGLPERVFLPPLSPGGTYELRLTANDFNTPPAHANTHFTWNGESALLFIGNAGPTAVATAAAQVECTDATGTPVTLDGSSSTDPDSTPGTNDDIASFDWYEDFGTPQERLLGTGDGITVALALGAHALTLQVTDSEGASDTDSITVTVADTTPPDISVFASPQTLWPPNHEMIPVHVTWRVEDLCDAAGVEVQLIEVTSSEPDDAPGTSDGHTTGDIQGVDANTADADVLLRAERDNKGRGRVYRLFYRALDGSGNGAEGLGVVTVPRQQGSGPGSLLRRLYGLRSKR
jgi:hypothetical protein